MFARGFNQFATPQNNLSLRSALRSALSVAVLGASVFLTVGVNKSHAEIISSVTEDIHQSDWLEYTSSKGGTACNKLENVTTFMGNTAHPVRSGKYAFRHWVNRCGERSELAMERTKLGNTYWYGWSMFIPADWSDTDAGYDILSQWPNIDNHKMVCGAAGTYLIRQDDGNVVFKLQHQGASSDTECNKYTLGKVSELRGKWVDLVMNVKWTGNKDGFLKLWMKSGNGSYTQKIDYTGQIYWNNNGGKGPYLKMGLYKGDPNFKGPAPRYLYTDEFRLGNDKSSFEEVSPH